MSSGIAGENLDPEQAVGRHLLAVIERRLALGLRESGLEAYYASRLSSGNAFPSYVRLIARAIAEGGPGRDMIMEVGAGLGELPMLLAAHGFCTCALERNKLRVAAIEELRSALAGDIPGFADRVTIHRGSFPCGVPGVDPANTLLISTCLVFTPKPGEEEDVVRGMLEYGSVIVDVARLVRYRRLPSQWPEVEERFAAAGYSVRSTIQQYVGENTGGKVIWYER